VIAGIIIIIAIAVFSFAVSQYYNQPYYVGERIILEPYQSFEQEIFHTKGSDFILFLKYNQIIPENKEIHPINAKVFDSQGKLIYQIKEADLFWECGGFVLLPGINCTFTASADLNFLSGGKYELKIINSQNTTKRISYGFGDLRYTTSVNP